MQRNWIGAARARWFTSTRPARSHRRVHHPPRHAVRRDVHGAGPGAPLVDALTTPSRPAWTGGASPSTAAAAAAKDDFERQAEGKREDRRVHRRVRHQPGQRQADPGLDRRLRADGLRHRRDHGRALRRPARLRVRPQVRSDRAIVAPCSRGDRHDTTWADAFTGDAPYANSANDEPQTSTAWATVPRRSADQRLAEAHGHGEATITYKLRDWLFSRQRYWGEPFPIVYDETATPSRCPTMLPVELPETDQFSPAHVRPRRRDEQPGEPARPARRLGRGRARPGRRPEAYRRDTNVMPQWAGSCWYELRYSTPPTTNALRRPGTRRTGWARSRGPRAAVRRRRPVRRRRRARRAAPAVRPLLAQGAVRPGARQLEEPFHRLFNQGYILAAAFQTSAACTWRQPRSRST
jgi:leucyl-tRNA synthetase